MSGEEVLLQNGELKSTEQIDFEELIEPFMVKKKLEMSFEIFNSDDDGSCEIFNSDDDEEGSLNEGLFFK